MEKYIEAILDAAEKHGNASPEGAVMEVGDLQTVIRLCWGVMTETQRTAVTNHWSTEALVGEWS